MEPTVRDSGSAANDIRENSGPCGVNEIKLAPTVTGMPSGGWPGCTTLPVALYPPNPTPFKNTVTEEPDLAGLAQEFSVPSLFNAIAWNASPNAAWPQIEVKVLEFTKMLGLLGVTA